MIINQPGAEYKHEGAIFRIGTPIVGTSESEYEGLFGSITEIETAKIEKRKMIRQICIVHSNRRYSLAKFKSWRRYFQNCISNLRLWPTSIWIVLSWHLPWSNPSITCRQTGGIR